MSLLPASQWEKTTSFTVADTREYYGREVVFSAWALIPCFRKPRKTKVYLEANAKTQAHGRARTSPHSQSTFHTCCLRAVLGEELGPRKSGLVGPSMNALPSGDVDLILPNSSGL